MSYNGSGTFQINTSGQPVVTGTVISSTAFNALTADLATGLSTAITKDGQTATTARIPFAQGINSSLATDTTSGSTGSIFTAGGVGITKGLFVGGTATFSASAMFSALTASSAVATDASKNLVSVTNTGTGSNVLGTAPTLATPNITSGLTLTSVAGTNGQVLTSAGSGNAPTWTTPSTASGTVTSVATGTGLTGGPVTTTGTISIDSTVVTLSGSQTLTNKTLTTPNIDSAQIATVSGTAPLYMARAWVNFNGSANTNLTGTYSQSGTTVTVTATAHGLIVDSSIKADITSGTGVDGIYTVTAITDANTFTYTAGTSLTTSGNITLLRNTIRASGNVSSITDNGTGDYTVNFTTALSDANYCWSMGGDGSGARLNTWGYAKTNVTAPTTSALRVLFNDDTSAPVDTTYACVTIHR